MYLYQLDLIKIIIQIDIYLVAQLFAIDSNLTKIVVNFKNSTFLKEF